jgi:5-formyltetrahydrofolate cyclo-ligase
MDVKTVKRLPRQEIWVKLESKRIARFSLPRFGRIPNFVGSESAADKVRLLYEWKKRTRFIDRDANKNRSCSRLMLPLKHQIESSGSIIRAVKN